jgi:predicted RND superfamily exporter protein
MFWNKVSNPILNNRKIIFFAIVLVTALMGYFFALQPLTNSQKFTRKRSGFSTLRRFHVTAKTRNVMIIAIESDKRT